MSVDFTGTWKNQLGSTLELSVTGGIVSGRFESGVGDDGKTIWVQVSGRVLEDVITFNAVYESYGTVVAWVGQHTVETGAGKIKALWLHATNVEDTQEQDWMWFSNRIGADVFSRA
jgi:hypothetical protein